ncbi:late competence development ComFB family protein [Christensenella intestinihominis]|uniref:late competence development ComFB family protein n=1 Tax=Christensenella intestinihominis TaxID=1851429 RepID=UPI0009F571C6|nr:late competence development ComFB family protein [Christensenella intestinihominis]
MDNETKIKIKNLTEDFVDQHLDHCIESYGTCNCARCRADIRAYALNHLPPHYVASEIGDAMVRHDAQTTQGIADIVAAIVEGIRVVANNPHH